MTQTWLYVIKCWFVLLFIIAVEDAKVYLSNLQRQEQQQQMQLQTNARSDSITSDSNIYTIDDSRKAREGEPPQKYDAALLFAEEEIDFATCILEEMEKQGFKVSVTNTNK